jgi:hypothetical protein
VSGVACCLLVPTRRDAAVLGLGAVLFRQFLSVSEAELAALKAAAKEEEKRAGSSGGLLSWVSSKSSGLMSGSVALYLRVPLLTNVYLCGSRLTQCMPSCLGQAGGKWRRRQDCRGPVVRGGGSVRGRDGATARCCRQAHADAYQAEAR